MKKAGFIGVGAMGGALIGRLARHGVGAVAYDVADAGRQRAVALNAQVVDRPSAVAEAVEIVGVMVRNDEETLDAVLGRHGALNVMSAGKILLLHSTIQPQTTRRIAEAARSRQVLVADAPVVGLPQTIQDGNGVALVGASLEDFARFESHLRLMFKDAVLMGPLGAGNAGKIIKNLTTAAEALVLAEALRLGEAAGIPYLTMIDMLTRIDQFHFIDHWQKAFDATGRSSEPLFIPILYDKDMPLTGRLAADLKLDAPLTRDLVAAAAAITKRAKGAA